MTKLPIGESSFESIRKGGFIYVDKTEKLYDLITNGKFYFLSRPRRFGKSLLISTLKHIFLANKELFKGLWIYDSDYEWEKHPVVVIDFNIISSKTPEYLEQSLKDYLNDIALDYDIELKSEILPMKFAELIKKLSSKYSSHVALLIDEYDKPIVTHLGRGKEELGIAKKNRDILREFYGTIKGESVISNLRFVLLTGVSKFSKAGVFSQLNNLADITMNAKYWDLLGITEEEIDIYFSDHLKNCAKELQMDIQTLKDALKGYYNGYRFSRKPRYVYNPFSLLNFLNEFEFRNYWFESGTPTFLVDLIKEKNLYIPQAEKLETEESVFSSYELDDLDPKALLFQTGYLTVKEYDSLTNIYVLGYPNKEVKTSFLKLLFREYVNSKDNIYLQLGRKLLQNDIEGFIEITKRIFSTIKYSVGAKLNEANFHTIFYLLVNAGGVPADMEILDNDSRIDMITDTPDVFYIVEFKCNQDAKTAINQIKEKYLEKYKHIDKRIILLGINFDTKKRNIDGWEWEEE